LRKIVINCSINFFGHTFIQLGLTRAKALQTVSRFPRETRRRYAMAETDKFALKIELRGLPGNQPKDACVDNIKNSKGGSEKKYNKDLNLKHHLFEPISFLIYGFTEIFIRNPFFTCPAFQRPCGYG
jgi:hypothetical protein